MYGADLGERTKATGIQSIAVPWIPTVHTTSRRWQTYHTFSSEEGLKCCCLPYNIARPAFFKYCSVVQNLIIFPTYKLKLCDNGCCNDAHSRLTECSIIVDLRSILRSMKMLRSIRIFRQQALGVLQYWRTKCSASTTVVCGSMGRTEPRLYCEHASEILGEYPVFLWC